MKKLLITGVPGSGKTTNGSYLEQAYGFRHLDMEANNYKLLGKFYKRTAKFLGRLTARDQDTVISWGFHPVRDKNAVGILLAHGFTQVWLDGDRPASFRAFMEREHYDPGKAEAYRAQIAAIAETAVVSSLQPAVINPFDTGGHFRPIWATAGDIVAASDPSNQETAGFVRELAAVEIFS